MYSVYVLWSEKLQKRYVGSTASIKQRLKEHNCGNAKFTSGDVPWILIYEEQFQTRTEARKRELYLKTGIGRHWLDEKLEVRETEK